MLRTPSFALALLAASLLATACGDGDPPAPAPQACSTALPCPLGQTCVGGTCQSDPCGGLCAADQLCTDAGACAAAQGASCQAGLCPTGFQCTAQNLCAKSCQRDAQCGAGLVCNASYCVECFPDDTKAVACNGVAASTKPWCSGGRCVQCRPNTRDCPSGGFCNPASSSCVPGCRTSDDCNVGGGEHCEGATASAPGRCVQCSVSPTVTASDPGCPFNIPGVPDLPACNPDGVCVKCRADRFCPVATPHCNVASAASAASAFTCVSCLPANDATGLDCGRLATATSTAKDPHTGKTCDPGSFTCTTGCRSDAQCGCTADPATGKPIACPRRFLQEKCDPALRSMIVDGTSTSSIGGCVECTANVDCRCKVQGASATTTPSCAGWPGLGGLNGARCTKDGNGYGACTEGCDADADCPSGLTCSLSGANAHKCVQCKCPVGATGAFCDNPAAPGVVGGCGLSGGATGVQLVCDTATLLCRLKRQGEPCSASAECGDQGDPTIGACLKGAHFCVKNAHGYTNPQELYCDPGKATGRCGTACVDNDPAVNSCNGASPPARCPSGSLCKTATSIDQPPGGLATTGKYCVPDLCTTP
jgi:hypothetical protein